jgi:hypothetical protein
MNNNITNLLDPLEFGDGEIDNFIRRYRCGICGEYLIRQDAPGYHRYNAVCVTHGIIIQGGAVRVEQIDKLNSDVIANRMDHRAPDRTKTEREILEDLGF